jgi:hypothetical protein
MQWTIKSVGDHCISQQTYQLKHGFLIAMGGGAPLPIQDPQDLLLGGLDDFRQAWMPLLHTVSSQPGPSTTAPPCPPSRLTLAAPHTLHPPTGHPTYMGHAWTHSASQPMPTSSHQVPVGTAGHLLSLGPLPPTGHFANGNIMLPQVAFDPQHTWGVASSSSQAPGPSHQWPTNLKDRNVFYTEHPQ